jgi:hypothetical protein
MQNETKVRKLPESPGRINEFAKPASAGAMANVPVMQKAGKEIQKKIPLFPY